MTALPDVAEWTYCLGAIWSSAPPSERRRVDQCALLSDSRILKSPSRWSQSSYRVARRQCSISDEPRLAHGFSKKLVSQALAASRFMGSPTSGMNCASVSWSWFGLSSGARTYGPPLRPRAPVVEQLHSIRRCPKQRLNGCRLGEKFL